MIQKIELAARNVQAEDVVLVGLRARHLYSLISLVCTFLNFLLDSRRSIKNKIHFSYSEQRMLHAFLTC